MMKQQKRNRRSLRTTFAWATAALLAIGFSSGCSGGLSSDRDVLNNDAGESCMLCHNGSANNNYAGPGMVNPHPFPGAENIRCTTCHGGNGQGEDKESSHVPPPPEIGDRERWDNNREAYFNRLTLAGLDKIDSYTTEDGRTYDGLDYLQWVNPGDVRVVSLGRSCGQCHTGHSDVVEEGILYTATGIFGGTAAYIGVDNRIPANQGLYDDTASDLAFRAVVDPNFAFNPNVVGPVGSLIEYPVYSRRVEAPDSIFRNNAVYNAAGLSDDFDAQGRVITDSPLHHLFNEQVAFTCGDCHLGSSGANNRSADYRSAGCTSCHMPYSITGRYGIENDRLGNPLVPIEVGVDYGSDPHMKAALFDFNNNGEYSKEPRDPDDIDDPEIPHVREHRIVSVARTLSNGVEVRGIDDYTCAGCHQGSNRTVMQYWGIRLDQNEDLRRGVQYPAQPVSYQRTNNDDRLFVEYVDYRQDPPEVRRTQEFNGRDNRQYILDEDYDGDNRDDTPPDIHYEAGMGCVDCHGSYDLHGGDVNNPTSTGIVSRMEHAVAIRCESCHGTVDSYAQTAVGVNYQGQTVQLAVDNNGRVLRHVELDNDGHFYMTSKLTGQRHFVVQTRDVVIDNGVTNPFTNQPVYSSKASYAMGRDDGNAATGTGPKQTGATSTGFSHMDNMSCASCHSSWSNSCIGCHLVGEYDNGNNFSNITGERIVFREDDAQFVYQSPVFMQLGIGPNNKIEQFAANTKVFFKYIDENNNTSQTFAFSDRQGNGNNPAIPYPSLGHNKLMGHSIRGKVSNDDEGPRYCVACHLTTDGLTDYGTIYDQFRTQMANDDYAALDYNMLTQHIGLNPGNQINSPVWVHHVAGLGSGLFQFDQNGAPVNPLDNDNNRFPNEQAPANVYDPNDVVFNLDKIVLADGTPTGANNHRMEMLNPTPNLRDGAPNPDFAGPLGATLIQKLTDPVNGIVLDSWLDANGDDGGDAAANR